MPAMQMDGVDLIDDVLLDEFHAACDRWRDLCKFVARWEGVHEEELQREVAWMQWRREYMVQHGSAAYLRGVIRDIDCALVWARSGLALQLFLVPCTGLAPR